MPGRRDIGSAGLAFFLTLACSALETPEVHYPTYAAALADGAVARGWVPDQVPQDATDIHEIHDLDTEEVWIRFSFTGDARAGFAHSCTEADPLHVAWPRATRRLSWWPEDMLQAATRPASPYHFFRCAAPDRYPGQSYSIATFLALVDGQQKAWYWRRP
jgi:hypothetical protein